MNLSAPPMPKYVIKGLEVPKPKIIKDKRDINPNIMDTMIMGMFRPSR